MTIETLLVRTLAKQDYISCFAAMQKFTNQRDAKTQDEIWLLEHPPVFTQGQNGKPEHIIDTGDIPLVQTDRGGQITYHGPGQLMVYTLIDLKRKQLQVRQLVTLLEQAVIAYLSDYKITAYAKCEAPGVYLLSQGDEKKICSIGLRIRRGCSYHGIAFNVAMNLEPFTRIHPCGYTGLKMTQLSDLGGPKDVLETAHSLLNYLMKNLRYTDSTFLTSLGAPDATN